jgi:hypothetical protein
MDALKAAERRSEMVPMLAPDRNVRALRSVEMSVYSTESIRRKSSAMRRRGSNFLFADDAGVIAESCGVFRY